MDVLFTIIPIGIVLSVAAFLFFEKRALAAKKAKEASHTEEKGVCNIFSKFNNYDTQRNVTMYFITVYVISFIIARVFYDESYGLVQALLYIFITTFLGSAVIFVMKLSKNLLVQVFATFLYGVPHIFAASLAFLTAYIIG